MSSSKEKIIEQAEGYLKGGRLDRAIKEYQRLVAEDPSDMRVRLKIADIYAKKREIPAAIKQYREVADAYSREGFHLKAIAVYKMILKLSPTLIEVNEKLGDLYRQVGLDNDAINQYYIVVSWYDSKGKVQEAMAVRQKIVAIDPSNTTGRIRLAEMLQSEGKMEESVREYEQVSEVLANRKDRDGLIEVYEKMLYLRPDNFEMLRNLCRIYFDKREFKRALLKIEAAPPEAKKDTDLIELWAEALLEDRQVDASRRKFKELYLAILIARDEERSARIYSRILQEFSDDQDYLNELIDARQGVGIEQGQVAPKYRQDFEKTEMIDLSRLDAKLDETTKKK